MKTRDPSIIREPAFAVGLILTAIIVLGFALALFSYPVSVSGQWFPTKWHYLKSATPNEIGDTLAGVAGSLAFVWLVVTVMLQAKELREQRLEFEKIAAAQEEQVKLLKIQGDIFLEEQRQRLETRATELLEQKLKRLLHIIVRGKKEFEIHGDPNEYFFEEIDTSGEDARFFHSLKDTLISYEHDIKNTPKEYLSPFPVSLIDVFEHLSQVITEITELLPSLSDAQRQRLNNLELEVVNRKLGSIKGLIEISGKRPNRVQEQE